MAYVIVQSLKMRLNYCNFYHLQGLWLKGCLKMHFLQVECKSSFRSEADSYLKPRGGQIMQLGLGAEATMRSMGKAPGQRELHGNEVSLIPWDEVPLKLMTFSYFRD